MKTTLITLFCFVFVLVFLWQIDAARTSFSGVVLYVAAPFWKIENTITDKIETNRVLFIDKQNLLNKNRNLEKEILRLRNESLEFDLLRQENFKLKDILKRRETTKTTILATVLAKPNRSPYDTLLLDVGKEDGVRIGDSIIAQGEIVIGRISEARKAISRAVLFSSYGEEMGVALGSESIQTTAYGIGGGNFEIKLPRGIDVQEGDVISFPEISSRVIGVIEKIKVQPSDSFQIILFKSPINLFQLRLVEVIVDSPQ